MSTAGTTALPGAGNPLGARLLAWWPALVLLGIAAASAWLHFELGKSGPQGGATAGSVARVPDFSLSNFETVNHDEEGRLERRLRATYMAHYADNGASEFESPSVTLYRTDTTPWQVDAERGWLSESGKVLLLLGEVHIWRNSEEGVKVMDVVTEDLRVVPDADYAETDKAVVITTPHSRTTGTGLRSYLDLGRMELLSDVKSVYKRNAYAN